MTEQKTKEYAAKTRAYMHSERGRLADRHMLFALGYSYERRLACHVMCATGMIVEEHIREVVDEIMLAELAVPA